MAPILEIWKHFTKGARANTAHFYAHCNYCRDYELERLRIEEEPEETDGIITVMSESELRKKGPFR